MHILSPEADNCPSWISGRERMTVENISRSISTKECCWPQQGLNLRPPGLQSDGASNWATEAGNEVTYSHKRNSTIRTRDPVIQVRSANHSVASAYFYVTIINSYPFNTWKKNLLWDVELLQSGCNVMKSQQHDGGTMLVHCVQFFLINARIWKKCWPWSDCSSDLGLHCLHMSFCQTLWCLKF